MKRLPIFALLLLGLGLLAAVAVAQEDLPDAPDPEAVALQAAAQAQNEASDEVLAEARSLVDDAADLYDRANNVVGTYLNLIEAIGVVLTLVGVVLGALGVSNLRQVRLLREESQKTRDELRDMLDNTEEISKETHRALENTRTFRSVIDENMKALSNMQYALRQLDIGNLSAAREALEQAREVDPNNPIINYFLGDLLVRMDQLETGVRYLEDAQRQSGSTFIAADASFAYAQRALGDRETKREDIRKEYYSRADMAFNRVYKVDKRLLDIQGESVFGAHAGLYRRRYAQTHDIADIRKAIEIYQHCEDVTPSRSYPLVNMALLMFRHSDDLGPEQSLARARELFRKVYTRATINRGFQPYNIWHTFDYLTAAIALEERSLDELKEYTEEMLDLQPTDDTLDKYLLGLRELAASPSAPVHVRDLITYTRDRYNQRRTT